MRAIILGLSLFCALPALAQTPAPAPLSGDQRWVVIASRQNIDEAIGVARSYTGARVFRSVNGWFAVVSGPREVKDPRKEKADLVSNEDYPKDIVFSKGDNYVEGIWQDSPAKPMQEYESDGSTERKSFVAGDLTVTYATEKQGDSAFLPVVTGTVAGRQVFAIHMEEAMAEAPRVTIRLFRLDPSSPRPQVMVTGYTGGAHCCYASSFATADASGVWHVVNGAMLDSGGYQVEDVDRDGLLELTHIDNSFLYAFASYAGSIAPRRIVRLAGKDLKDVTGEPRYQSFLRQDLASIEHFADKNGIGEANGYLAGWVAAKALVGQFDEAWKVMMQRYERRSAITFEACTLPGVSQEKCPPGKLKKRTFPEALREHLVSNGYPVPR